MRSRGFRGEEIIWLALTRCQKLPGRHPLCVLTSSLLYDTIPKSLHGSTSSALCLYDFDSQTLGEELNPILPSSQVAQP